MIWRDGELLPPEMPLARASDRGLTLGDGLFETIKVASGRALFLTKHLARLHVAGRELGLKIDRHRLRDGALAYLAAENAAAGTLRIMVTRGPGPRGLSPIPAAEQRPSCVMVFYAAGDTPPPQTTPDRLIEAPFIRSSGAVTSRHKTLSYADNLAAIAHAREEGAADVLFFNERGEAACSAMANIFVRKGPVYLTPPLSAGILPGIVRAILLEEAQETGLPIEVKPIRREDLKGRLLFRTNSLIGVRPAWLDDGEVAVRPVMDEDDGLLSRVYRLAERREEGA